MFVIASEKFTFPLAFFMQMNISFINSNLHEFERTRLAHESKTFILDIDDMEKAKTGPSRDNKMTMLDWWKAYDNYYAFEASRYKSLEHSPRALFSKAHFNFIVNQEDSDELYHIWRPYGAKLRRQYYELETEFDEVRYANTWSEINSISASKPLPYASKEPPQHSSLSKNQQSSSNHPLSSSSYLPFCASNKGPAPRCVGCGKWDHKLGDRNANHGRFPFAAYSGTELRAREGGGKICIPFNCFGSCTKGCPQSNHVCSLCGGPHACRDNHSSCARIN